MTIIQAGNTTKSSTNPNFVKPKAESKVQADPIFSERYNRTVRAFRRAHLSYNPGPEDYAQKRRDGNERVNKQLMETYPDLTSRRIIRLSRILFPPGLNLYEDQDGNIDPKVRSALIFTIECMVEDEDSVKAGVRGKVMEFNGTGAGKCSYNIGLYEHVVPDLTFDRNHNVIDSKVAYYTHRYYVKDSPAEIKRICKLYNNGVLPSRLSVAVATERGPLTTNGEVFAVFNQNEFINEPIELLIGGNRKGLLSEHSGGVKVYKQYLDIENKLLESGEVSALELSRYVNKDSIVQLIKEKSKASK